MVTIWTILIDQSNKCILCYPSNGVIIAMIPNLDVDQLKTFLAIADTGSFTRAAEEVNKTQSAVSMQMKRLEEQLMRPLFSRDGRGTKFTRDGELLIDYARRIVALSDEACQPSPSLTSPARCASAPRMTMPNSSARHSRPLRPQRTRMSQSMWNALPSSQLQDRTKRSEIDIAVVTFGCAADAQMWCARRN